MSEIEDIWDFLPVDDESDSTVAPSADEAAVHVAVPAEWQRPFDDPARREVATSEEDPRAVSVADDEDDDLMHRDTERELDVEELLERQHYAFALSTEDEGSW